MLQQAMCAVHRSLLCLAESYYAWGQCIMSAFAFQFSISWDHSPLVLLSASQCRQNTWGFSSTIVDQAGTRLTWTKHLARSRCWALPARTLARRSSQLRQTLLQPLTTICHQQTQHHQTACLPLLITKSSKMKQHQCMLWWMAISEGGRQMRGGGGCSNA